MATCSLKSAAKSAVPGNAGRRSAVPEGLALAGGPLPAVEEIADRQCLHIGNGVEQTLQHASALRQDIPFFAIPAEAILPVMETDRRPARLAALKIAAAIALVAGATGAAFAAWIDNGPQMLMSMTAAGLAWCF
jgi:hypothetical protein